MIEELIVFRRKAKENGVCQEGLSIFDEAKSKKELFDLASSIQGIEFICMAKQKDFLPKNGFIKGFFSNFINQPYENKSKNYNTGIYIGNKISMIMDSNISCFIDCSATIKIPTYITCYIYACGNSHIKIEGKGSAVVVAYGDSVTIDNHSLKTKIKRVS